MSGYRSQPREYPIKFVSMKIKVESNYSAVPALGRKTEDRKPAPKTRGPKFPANVGPQSFYVREKLRSPVFGQTE